MADNSLGEMFLLDQVVNMSEANPPTLPKKNLIFSGGLFPRQRQGETRSGEECCSKVVRSRCPWQEKKLQRILSKTVWVNEARPCTSVVQIEKDEKGSAD